MRNESGCDNRPVSSIEPVYAETLGLPLVHAGRTHELYEAPGRDAHLMVAIDRLPLGGHILTPEIPDKGIILSQMSLWWFDRLGVDNHVISTDVPDAVAGRAVIVEKLTMFPVVCVACGYLTGQGWMEYQQTGHVCGVPLPEGLREGSRLDTPIFTPVIKAGRGEDDEYVDFSAISELVGPDIAHRLRDLTLDLYRRAEGIARERGVIIADAEFEFGQRSDGTIVLAGEALTPDSSRFWDAETWPQNLVPWGVEYVRDWLVNDSGWDQAGDMAVPELPVEVVTVTRQRYCAAYTRLTGRLCDGDPAQPEKPKDPDIAQVEAPRPDDLRGGIVRALRQQAAVETELREAYDREERLLREIEQHDDELSQYVWQLQTSLAERDRQLTDLRRRYDNLASSKMGRIQRAWWNLRSRTRGAKPGKE
ncbi:phosphoribosylaminoimidazole-succinocarboxamide synthase [Propioniferax innocua]|uniref:Phosphoribosylaminoimidazole-succinocarboxamide synthase n=1 Tax=Propioniferax innocua TaxID=1753 RepID=A0A542ZD57_9ACTN|nr:phosphoribosylaminoimidazole-succinocarboxamide synthase [Propioniferax innocua]